MGIERVRKSINWKGPPLKVAAMAGLLLLSVASAAATIPLRAQPELLQMAAAMPDAQVGVIVQKAATNGSVEALVTALGGKVTDDLSIINAFAAQLKASAIPQLARAGGVRWVSLDAPVARSGGPVSTLDMKSAFVQSVRADAVWNEAPGYLQGQGITVAVVDSGDCSACDDLGAPGGPSRLFSKPLLLGSPNDLNGHGALVEGIVGANGAGSQGQYMGVAPGVNLMGVKVANSYGKAVTSQVILGLAWVLLNAQQRNIRVVNLSLNSTVSESYNNNPLDAAIELLWFNRIVVVVSAGNNGTATLYPPANDPFVITVGATNDQGTPGLDDDTIAPFSAYGASETGGTKPELVAPGMNLVSIVPISPPLVWQAHPEHRLSSPDNTEQFMRVSGTSFAAPVVSGAVALLLQSNPSLNPDQVKYRLMATANKNWPGYDPVRAGAGYLDIYAAVHGGSTESANTGLAASLLLGTGGRTPSWANGTWNSVNWNSVNWNSVNWNSVDWNSVDWNSVDWNSDYWGP